MEDEGFDSDEFDWDLQSSKVRAGNKLPIPEGLREKICMESGEDDVTWWCYDQGIGIAFLSSRYVNGERYNVVNGRNYKLEKNSRITIPKTGSNEVVEGVLGDRPEKGDTVYFYTDSRLLSDDSNTAFVLSKAQMGNLMNELKISEYMTSSKDEEYLEEYDAEAGTERKRSLAKDLDNLGDKEKILKDVFPVPK